MQQVVIAAAARTPIGAFGGAFTGTSAVELGIIAARAAFERAGISPEQTDEVILGNVLGAGLGQNVARQVAIGAGCPVTVPAMTINKVCGSALRSVTLAAQMIRCGDAEVVLAGGTENMSQAPYLDTHSRWGARMGTVEIVDSMVHDGLWDVFNNCHMGNTAENVASRWTVTREDQDSFAAESQRRAEAAQKAGRFGDEIAPVPVTDRKGRTTVVDTDEHPRHGTTVDALATLRPAFTPDGTVTAGNASGINDGAAVLLVMSERRATELGVPPLVTLDAYASSGIEPEVMGVAPIEAIRSALQRAGVGVGEIDLWEVNEAFASQALAIQREIGIPSDRLNVNGGAIALGHPIGASGARVLVTLIHEMVRRNALQGVAALCIGGGQSDAVVVRRGI